MRCGTLLVQACPRCEFRFSEGAHFCGNCGLGLTPQAQFIWQNQPAAQIFPSEQTPIKAPPETEVRYDPAPVRPQKQAASAQPLLDPYIPKELMTTRSRVCPRRNGGGTPHRHDALL